MPSGPIIPFVLVSKVLLCIGIIVCAAVFCYVAKANDQKQDEKKTKKAAKSLKVLDPKAGQNLCK